MWQVYALMAQDLAREREREAQARRLAREASAMEAEEMRRHPGLATARPARIGGVRRLLAAALRGVEAMARTLARAACATAARVEGRGAQA